MNIGINPLTGGLEFETHEELKEEIYNIKQNIQNMSKKSIVFRDINANFDPQPSRLSQEERLKSI